MTNNSNISTAVIDNHLLAIKVRRVFNDVNTVWGLPTGVFYSGLVFVAFIYLVTRSIFFIFFSGGAYFSFMFFIHKFDLLGLKVWVEIFSDQTNTWEVKRSVPIIVNFIKND